MKQPRLPGFRRRSRAWAGSLLLLPLLAGCSGSPFGEALSRSFPAPNGEAAGTSPDGAANAARSAAAGDTDRPGSSAAPGAAGSAAGREASTPGAGPGGTSKVAGPRARPAAPGAKAGSPGTPAAVPAPAAAAAPAPAGRPAAGGAPYRVTIRLPMGDPSAPAEVVTQALRAAGVPFEVETIERIDGASTPAAGAGAPAAGGSGAPLAAPLVRPAPPPR